MDWFTSDTHFSSEKTKKFSCRPFDTTKEMDRIIAENWNSKIAPNDTVWHLGDFGDFDVIEKYSLNGKINLILGNYEEDMDQDELLEAEEKYGFTIIERNVSQPFIKTFPKNLKINMVHKPSEMIPDIPNLYGHVHRLSMVKKFIYDDKPYIGLNVGTDCHHFYPINLDDVKFQLNGIVNHYDEEVFL